MKRIQRTRFRSRDSSSVELRQVRAGEGLGFADELRDAIRDSGVSQYQLAKASGVPQGAISVFMHGGDLMLSTFNCLACAMGLELLKN